MDAATHDETNTPRPGRGDEIGRESNSSDSTSAVGWKEEGETGDIRAESMMKSAQDMIAISSQSYHPHVGLEARTAATQDRSDGRSGAIP